MKPTQSSAPEPASRLVQASAGLDSDFSKPEPDISGGVITRTDDYLDRKIRNLCFLMTVMVVYNHARTIYLPLNWNGMLVAPPEPEYLQSAPVELFIEQFLTGALGRITNPIFFVASGYLFFFGYRPTLRAWAEKARRRVRTLLIPYLVWGFFGMLLMFGVFVANNWRALASEKVGASVWDLALVLSNMSFRPSSGSFTI